MSDYVWKYPCKTDIYDIYVCTNVYLHLCHDFACKVSSRVGEFLSLLPEDAWGWLRNGRHEIEYPKMKFFLVKLNTHMKY